MSAKASGLSKRSTKQGWRIALFGGTFDPIHSGHLAVARAAVKRFGLDRVYFIPSSHPPHKPLNELLAYEHRFGMVALACAGELRFIPSLAECAVGVGSTAFYSVDTVRRFLGQFSHPGDRLYFILGADSFLQIATWRDYRILLGLCDFIVASRPGFRTSALREVIPAELICPDKHPHVKPGGAERSIALLHSSIHLLDTVASRVSATDVRRRLDRRQSVRGLVPPRVEEYITKQALYRPS